MSEFKAPTMKFENLPRPAFDALMAMFKVGSRESEFVEMFGLRWFAQEATWETIKRSGSFDARGVIEVSRPDRGNGNNQTEYTGR